MVFFFPNLISKTKKQNESTFFKLKKKKKKKFWGPCVDVLDDIIRFLFLWKAPSKATAYISQLFLKAEDYSWWVNWTTGVNAVECPF